MTINHPVLVAIDFSPGSAAAFRIAKRIAAWRQAKVTAVHVVTPVPMIPLDPLGMGMGSGVAMAAPSDCELVMRAHEKWARFIERNGGSGGARFTVELGSPRDRILEVVKNERPSVLVVGAVGTLSSPAGLGTTASACVQRAAAPVLIARPTAPERFRSVVACVEFDETAHDVLRQAVTLAGEEGSALHVLHVYTDPWRDVEPSETFKKNMPGFAKSYQQAVQRRLKEFCEPMAHELSALKTNFHAVEASSYPEGIQKFILIHGCDLAVLGTRGKFNLRDFFWGSTAERVVRESSCSILAVKPPGFIRSGDYQPLADAAVASESRR